MAGNGIQVASGGISVKNNGIVVAGSVDQCCCTPCTSCTATQPSAIITVSGSCASGCSAAAGTIPWRGFGPFGSDACIWVWLKESFEQTIELDVIFCPDAGLWYAQLGGTQPLFGNSVKGATCGGGTGDLFVQIPGVMCSGGYVSGLFTLQGSYFITNCTGCTASVTLGP